MNKKYRKRPEIVTATQWNEYGDHEIVDPYLPNCSLPCHSCKRKFNESLHGILKIKGAKMVVCPGDFVTQNVLGEYSIVKPDVFRALYEAVEFDVFTVGSVTDIDDNSIDLTDELEEICEH